MEAVLLPSPMHHPNQAEAAVVHCLCCRQQEVVRHFQGEEVVGAQAQDHLAIHRRQSLLSTLLAGVGEVVARSNSWKVEGSPNHRHPRGQSLGVAGVGVHPCLVGAEEDLPCLCLEAGAVHQGAEAGSSRLLCCLAPMGDGSFGLRDLLLLLRNSPLLHHICHLLKCQNAIYSRAAFQDTLFRMTSNTEKYQKAVVR